MSLAGGGPGASLLNLKLSAPPTPVLAMLPPLDLMRGQRAVPFGRKTDLAIDRYLRLRASHTFAHLPDLHSSAQPEAPRPEVLGALLGSASGWNWRRPCSASGTRLTSSSNSARRAAIRRLSQSRSQNTVAKSSFMLTIVHP
jgi:hypothetical protein